MSEEEKKAMDELIKFSKKWMKKFNEEKLIFSGQEIKDIVGLSERIYGGIYKEDNIDYDPDSSPFAWKYYHTMYSELISWTDNENKTDKKYYRREGIRKIAVFSLGVNHTLQQIKYQEYSEENDTSSLKYGGDCAFNFNNLKYARFLKLVNNKDLYNKLNFCAMMHHSPFNFSLMPRTGNLNNAKGTGTID
ncbi:hypothetical protein SAMN05421767_1225 [Granulicatella balaenopterae]|uniref:Uncharacterized protein n=1 Tax=Granulicatella balaenopterae TaxID=137733 RepID=A0A1H9LWH6_9LACT|nr:hypothetical protein [Granulicatella balaenopterae]SER15567.1 hypothetical protein SAMN05421767_1225 [Granulicatella balaenopterae]